MTASCACAHPVLERELGSLRIDDKKGKVDHPPSAGSSKDVSDALAGAVFQAAQNFATGTSLWAGPAPDKKEGWELETPTGILGVGFESEQEYLEFKLERGIPLTAGEIERFK